MKKAVIILPLIFLVGCTTTAEDNKYTYLSYKSELQKKEEFDKEDDSHFSSYFNVKRQSKEVVEYSIIVENPRINMHNVKALLIHDFLAESAFPSVGIFEEPKDLLVGTEDRIILKGVIQTEDDISNVKFRLYLEYTDDQGEENKIYYKLSRG